MPIHPCRTIAAALCIASCAHAGANPRGRPTNDFGIDFVRIGAPGNRAALPEERYYNQRFENLGRVNYRYRISKTEVTAAQWLDFVNAYDPYWVASGGARGDTRFSSFWIRPASSDPTQPGDYYIIPGTEQLAIETTWRIAARFANWLHNGQVNEQWAFDTGVYDASTFGGNAQDGYTDQAVRSPGARFWLPSVDEWTKAAHYDPNRYGDGQEGYWLRMGGQDDPLASGLPGVGQTSGGANFPPGYLVNEIPVGSYPDVDGPWGLLDTSGGVQEWTETVRSFYDDGVLHSGRRYALGSQAGDSGYDDKDLIDWYFTAGWPSFGAFGIRLASAIPAPNAALSLLALSGLASRRRR